MARSRRPSGVLIVGLIKQAFDFFEAKVSGQGAANLGRFEIESGINGDEILNLCIAKEIAQSDEMAGDGAGFELLAIEVGEKVDDDLACNGFEREFALLGKLVELDKIAPIGRGGVRRKPLLDARMGKKRCDEWSDFHQEPPILRHSRCRASQYHKLPEFRGNGISR